jgi:calnexin
VLNNSVWRLQIYLGNSEKAAADFAALTFDVKKPIEEAAEKASKPVTSDDDDSAIGSLRDFSIPSFLADPVNYARSQVTGFVQSAVKDPKGTVQRMPQTAAVVGGLAATLLGMIGLLLGLLAPKPATVKAKSRKVVEKVEIKKEEVKSQAATTASDVGKKSDGPDMFVKQRTTRSTTAAAAGDAN